ncbi:MAG: sugar ABC transporter ATP-binding protein [Spirochaetia bacterium]|nr:sugar ABC transporter ATP-binding protein [Spirochaetia bacterium]
MSNCVFQAKNISMSFPGVKALQHVSVDLYTGEILALLGENGAGKSTFIKVASGVYTPDEGEVYLQGALTAFSSPRDAFDAGIAVVHQELNSFPELTIAENIMLSDHPRTRLGIIDWKRMNALARSAMSRLDMHLDPEKKMKDCLIAEKQQIEIARALFWNAKILILDEPTSSLNDIEIRNLFTYLQKISKMGVSIIYISHKLEEIFELAHRVVVLRDGEVIASTAVAETDNRSLIKQMVGRDISDLYPKRTPLFGRTILEVRHLHTEQLDDISFDVRRGEIFGIYGLMGSGHLEIGKALFGYGEIPEGEILIDGEPVQIRNSHDAVQRGLAYVPGERKTEGLVLSHSITSNMMIAHYEVHNSLLISARTEQDTANSWVDALSIKTPGISTEVGTLSGGNQQKVVLSKWLDVNPGILILNEPTRGIDVGAKAGIYAILNKLCAEGLAIIMITSEIPELVAMSDRTMVVCEGRQTGLFTKEEISEVHIMASAIGADYE